MARLQRMPYVASTYGNLWKNIGVFVGDLKHHSLSPRVADIADML